MAYVADAARRRVAIVTLRAIAAGEELFVSYGDAYWAAQRRHFEPSCLSDAELRGRRCRCGEEEEEEEEGGVAEGGVVVAAGGGTGGGGGDAGTMLLLLLRGQAIGLAPPDASRDAAMAAIFADGETMRHLPSLRGMPPGQMAARRARHRAEAGRGAGLMLDVIDLGTGELVGSSGFRVVQRRKATTMTTPGLAEGAGGSGSCSGSGSGSDSDSWAEWGIIVDRRFWRRGIAAEAQRLCAGLAARTLGVLKMRAATTPGNAPMHRFFAKHGWRALGALQEEEEEEEDGEEEEWIHYEIDVAT